MIIFGIIFSYFLCLSFIELLGSFGLLFSSNLRAISFLSGEGNGTRPVLLPGKSHGWRSLVGCISWGCEESDTTERLHFHFALSCIGEGNGNPLQCSCLENPRDGGAWWAAVYGIMQSRTRLKRLSSSFLSIFSFHPFADHSYTYIWLLDVVIGFSDVLLFFLFFLLYDSFCPLG